MEVLSFCYSMPCCHVESLNLKLVERSLDLSRSKLFVARKTRVVCAGKNSKRNSIEFPDLEFLHYSTIQSPDHQKWSRLFSLLKGSQNVASSNALNVSYDGYVIDGKEGVRRFSESEDSVTKVLIPGLPDEPGGDFGSKISSCFWEWKPKLTVHYEKSGSENINSPAVLFLPGFGVGSFHYEKQLKDLGRDYRVWAVDFLGQGMSLVSEDPAPVANENGGSEENDMMWGFGEESKPWANELVYSVDLWRDQVSHFIEQVIGEPVYVVGNSLGGFVAVYFAAYNPQLVKGVTLLNATPFWGLLPNPIRSPWLAGIFPWAGTFPLPANVRKLTEFVWQKISDPRSIGEILEQVYADHSTRVDKVFSRILEITQHPAAAASFASIMFAPRGQLSFKESLSKCQINNVPICLMYGKEDPWVNSFCGFQVKRQLPDTPYYEISPAGHCPHDEVPEVVNYLLRGWMKNIESQGSSSLPLLDDPDFIDYGVSKNLEFIREGSKKSVRVHFFGSRSSIWNQISSFFKSRITDLGIKSPLHR